MRQSQLFTRTLKETSAADVSRNAQLLTRAGFVNKTMAGVYSFLPLGLRTLTKIENIVRDEMNALGGQEILMPALHPKDLYDTTNRWQSMDEVLFKFKGAGDRDLALGATHEETVTPLVTGYIQSYRDLPQATYQIQTKFRNEARAKSGILRGREFRMKDLYSFHANQTDLDEFYERAIIAYQNVFRRVGLEAQTLLTYAAGGVFSKYSHEFQTITPYGEDTIYKVPGTKIAINKEIIDDAAAVAQVLHEAGAAPDTKLEEDKAIEVGNIFKLGTKFSNSFNASYTNAEGNRAEIIMGCYGIGTSRLMGAVVEVLADDKGVIWPSAIAPYHVHLISLAQNDDERNAAEALYQNLYNAGIEVLFDDRADMSAGAKFADADLLGLPWRVVISKKTLAQNAVEAKARTAANAELLATNAAINKIKAGL